MVFVGQRLILTDVDDTILPKGEKRVSERTHQAFVKAVEAGHIVGVCTGRNIDYVAGFFDGDERCFANGIATNGLTIHLNGECVLKRTISPEQIAALAEAVAKIDHAGLVYFDGTQPCIVAGVPDDLAYAFPAYAAKAEMRPVPSEPAVKVNAFISGDVDATRAMAETLKEAIPELDFDVPKPGFNNIMPAGWNKGTATLWLADHLGIDHEDIFTFGDAENDLTMLRAAPNSVAVANAMPIVTETARWHIGACEDDAVAIVIEALAAGEFPFTE